MEALLRAGFRIRNRGNGLAILVRNGKLVMIPDVGVIEGDLLRAILRSAGVSRTELEAHLAHGVTRSGFFTKAFGPENRAASKADALPSASKSRTRG